MSAVAAHTTSPGPTAPPVSRTPVIIKVLKNPLGLLAVIVLTIVLLTAIFASQIAPFDPNFANISKTLAPPDSENLLGTDSAGRDVFSRLVFGAQVTLLSAMLCAVVAIGIGLPSGLIAGYYGSWFDSAANWVVSIIMSLPAIVMLLTVRAAIGPSVWISMIVFGFILSPGYFRLTRTSVQSVRNELYVDAARVSGLSDAKIISRHILSVVRAPIIIQTANVMGVAIAIQSGLEFLGLGDPTVATWGVMLSDGFRNVYIAPLLMVWPALAIGVTIGSLVLLGNAVRDALEDREKVKKRKNATEPQRAESRASRTIKHAPEVAPHDDSGERRVVTVSNLAVGYPQADGGIKKVVEDVSFHIDRGEVLGIVGESGSGKSQTAFSVLGLLPEEAEIVGGSIVVDGVTTVPEGARKVDQGQVRKLRGKRVSYIPQEPMSNLDPAFTIGAQLTRPMVKVLGISKAEARQKALDLLAAVGIPDPNRTMKAYPHEVSGGMAQRVLIAGAISCDPDLIIADEPTTALDVTVQAEVLDLLRDLLHRLDAAVILVTHNFGVVADLCDRVAVMQLGQLVEEGPVRSILRDPQHPYTQTLLGSMLVGKEPMTMLTDEAQEGPGPLPDQLDLAQHAVPADDGPDPSILEDEV